VKTDLRFYRPACGDAPEPFLVTCFADPRDRACRAAARRPGPASLGIVFYWHPGSPDGGGPGDPSLGLCATWTVGDSLSRRSARQHPL